tara:strand:- start:868 stop:1044 length:177 start_codon:yes stop_codon:yes gene_type:complete
MEVAFKEKKWSKEKPLYILPKSNSDYMLPDTNAKPTTPAVGANKPAAAKAIGKYLMGK